MMSRFILLLTIFIFTLSSSKSSKKETNVLHDCGSLRRSSCTKNVLCEWRIYQHKAKCVNHDSTHETPKNIILCIADGFGINANAAYRFWKNLDATMTDKYLVGEYSVYGTGQAVSDSAATATALGSGEIPRNSDVGIDKQRNPIANILYGAKKKGKGVAVVTTTRVNHATPASFTAHSVSRWWSDLIAYQQATRLNVDIDVLLGGGLRFFDGSRNDNLFNITEDFKELGWNSVSLNKDDLLLLNEEDIPAIGLFSSGNFPDYLARKNIDSFSSIPGLLDMTKKTLELLSNIYEKKGFFIMIEAGQPDFGAHANDLSYVLNEVDEYMNTLDYIINDFISNREEDDTLIVMTSDHDSGGLSLGRASQWDSDFIVFGTEGPRTVNVSTTFPQSVYSFDYDPLVPAPPSLIDELGETSMYQFFTDPLDYTTLTAIGVTSLIRAEDHSENMDDVFDLIEQFYIEELTEQEKVFLTSCYNRNPDTLGQDPLVSCLVKIYSIRTNTGWTTHGHTANDVRVSAYGPGSDRFKGFNGNIENIGRKLIDIFKVGKQIERINQHLKHLFLMDRLKLCDETEPLPIEGFGVNDSIPWPNGNYKYPGFCVEQFVNDGGVPPDIDL